MTELNISTQETIQAQGEALPIEPTPITTPTLPKQQNRRNAPTQAEKDAKKAEQARKKAELERKKAQKQAEKEAQEKLKAEAEAIAKRWENIKLDLSDPPVKGATMQVYTTLTDYILSGFIVIPGLDVDGASKQIETRLQELKKAMLDENLSIDEFTDLSKEVTTLNSQRGNAARSLAQNWIKSFVFSGFYASNLPATNSGNNSPIPTNNQQNNNVPKIAMTKQSSNEFKAWLAKNGKPQSVTPYIVANSSILQEQWAAIPGAQDFMSNNGYQLLGRDSTGNYIYLAPLGTSDSGNNNMKKYREVIFPDKSNIPNNGIHVSTYENKWATDNNFSVDSALVEFQAWAERVSGVKRNG